jgi:hypothetical protein
MVVTIITKKSPYIYPDIDGFQVETDGEGLNVDIVTENGKQIVRFGNWTEQEND